MPRGRSAKIVRSRVIKLKEIALSPSNTYSERMRAIDLLGQLDENAYDELAFIAAWSYLWRENECATTTREDSWKNLGHYEC